MVTARTLSCRLGRLWAQATRTMAALALASCLCSPALAGGFTLETAYTSSFGPDSYGTMHLRAHTDRRLTVGALLLGGTEQAALVTTGQTLSLSKVVDIRGELQLGMLRTNTNTAGGPTGGFIVGADFHLAPLSITTSFGFLNGVGFYEEGGVEVKLSERWLLKPRLRAETWAGDRDLALRVGMGVEHRTRSGWRIGLLASAGGRDVRHMGPGFVLNFGRIK